MGRLVDENDVYSVLTEYYHHKTATQHVVLIDALSTVKTAEAIPVEWIKAYIEDVDAMPDKLVWGHDKNAILTMLRAWEVRKEQNGKAD